MLKHCFMKNFINLWQDEKNRYISKDKQYKLSLIEMLVALEIPVEIVLMSINKNIDIAKIKEIKKNIENNIFNILDNLLSIFGIFVN